MPRDPLRVAPLPSEPSEEDLELLADGALGVAEAARFAGVGRSTIYAALAAGELRSLRRGRRRLIPRRALVAWLAAGLHRGA